MAVAVAKETIHYIGDIRYVSSITSDRYKSKQEVLLSHIRYIEKSAVFVSGDKNLILENAERYNKRANSRVAGKTVFALPNDIDKNDYEKWSNYIRKVLSENFDVDENFIYVAIHEEHNLQKKLGTKNLHAHVVFTPINRNGKPSRTQPRDLKNLHKAWQEVLVKEGYTIRKYEEQIGKLGWKLRKDDELLHAYKEYLDSKKELKQLEQALEQQSRTLRNILSLVGTVEVETVEVEVDYESKKREIREKTTNKERKEQKQEQAKPEPPKQPEPVKPSPTYSQFKQPQPKLPQAQPETKQEPKPQPQAQEAQAQPKPQPEPQQEPQQTKPQPEPEPKPKVEPKLKPDEPEKRQPAIEQPRKEIKAEPQRLTNKDEIEISKIVILKNKKLDILPDDIEFFTFGYYGLRDIYGNYHLKNLKSEKLVIKATSETIYSYIQGQDKNTIIVVSDVDDYIASYNVKQNDVSYVVLNGAVNDFVEDIETLSIVEDKLDIVLLLNKHDEDKTNLIIDALKHLKNVGIKVGVFVGETLYDAIVNDERIVLKTVKKPDEPEPEPRPDEPRPPEPGRY